jgi:hypothetical protein
MGHMSANPGVLSKSIKQYRRRKPLHTPYYQCTEDYYEEFKEYIAEDSARNMAA